MSPNALFFAGAGLCSAGNGAMFQELESRLPDMYPDLTFAFLSDPFEDLPLPFLLGDAERHDYASCRILEYGARLGRYANDVLGPAMSKHDVVFAKRFGLTGATRATAYHRGEDDLLEALHSHHNFLVPMFIKEKGLHPPVYLIQKTEDTNKVLAYMHQKRPLKNVSDVVLRQYIKHQLWMIGHYTDDPRQKTPIWLDASMTIEDMCSDAIRQVCNHIDVRFRVAA